MIRPLLQTHNLGFSYFSKAGTSEVLKDLNIYIEKGEFLSIVGPSGCGKSTLLTLLQGLIAPTTGEIIREPLSSYDSLRIGYMLQKDNLLEWRTVYKNALLGLEVSHNDTPVNRAKVQSLLKQYGLYNFCNYHPSALSGGMRQRVALIRTLALEPDLLLLDEPFSALDYITRLKVGLDIRNILKEQNKTAVLVTHDPAEAISLSDRIYVLSGLPATVQTMFPIRLTTNYTDISAVRNAPEFSGYYSMLWEELNHE